MASPTTATRATNSSAALNKAARFVGGSACSSSDTTVPSEVTGRKKSRCRPVWVNTNTPYRMSEAMAANTSWAGENSGPGRLVVKVGSTRVSVANAATVARAVPVPSALNRGMLNRKAPISSTSPTMPLRVIITAANTVSRASDAVSGPPETIRLMIRPTSITVTATASTTEPNGSPTRWATTSAWCTADSTAAPSAIPTRTTTPYGG